jgi:hypothetical protein
MGDGTARNPYTRKDVLRLIKKHGGTARGLDLSGKYFEKGANLRKINLRGVVLKSAYLEEVHFEEDILAGTHLEDAWLADAHLEGTDLEEAHFEGAWLMGAHLEGAYLGSAHLEGANLQFAYLQEAYLEGAEISHETKLEYVAWGNYILGEEIESFFAPETYQRLKMWYTQHGIYDVAGKFFYREKEAERKSLSWKKPHLKLWSWILRILCGYGEKPERVIISAAAIIFGLAAAYFLWGTFSSSSFADTLYYSVASFTALGYGQWAPQPTGWAKGVGAAEAVLGVSMLALFLVTFTRKMIR